MKSIFRLPSSGFWLPASVLCLLITRAALPTNGTPKAAIVSQVVRTNVNLSVHWTPARDTGGYPVDAYEVIITVREHTKVGWSGRAPEATYQVK